MPVTFVVLLNSIYELLLEKGITSLGEGSDRGKFSIYLYQRQANAVEQLCT
jgi:hypothetical protein